MAHSLIELHGKDPVNQILNFCEFADFLAKNPVDLKDLYTQQFNDAPKRAKAKPKKKYFLDKHKGVKSPRKHSNRRKEHLAGALFRATKKRKKFFLNNSELSFRDYQFPLKACQADEEVGKVDLFCTIGNSTGDSTPAVAKLKVSRKGDKLGDTPLKALLEGLTYCAIVEANADVIAGEAKVKFGIDLKVGKPELLIMAPSDYWSGYLNKEAAGLWTTTIKDLADKIYDYIKIKVHFLSLEGDGFEMGLNNKFSKLIGNWRIELVKSLN